MEGKFPLSDKHFIFMRKTFCSTLKTMCDYHIFSTHFLPSSNYHNVFGCLNFRICVYACLCMRVCVCVYERDLPGDIEEREANAVFDENGEVFHIKHWLAE